MTYSINPFVYLTVCVFLSPTIKKNPLNFLVHHMDFIFKTTFSLQSMFRYEVSLNKIFMKSMILCSWMACQVLEYYIQSASIRIVWDVWNVQISILSSIAWHQEPETTAYACVWSMDWIKLRLSFSNLAELCLITPVLYNYSDIIVYVFLQLC